jgi:hypothetical protein
MKIDDSLLKEIIVLTQDYFSKYDDYKFKEEYKKNDFMLSYKRHISEISHLKFNGSFFSIFEELALYNIEYMSYIFLSQDFQEERIETHLQLSNHYSFSMLTAMVESNDCLKPSSSIWMKNGGLFLASNIISNNWASSEKIVDIFLLSIEGKNSVIGYGHPQHVEAWFLLDLFCKVFDKTYNNDRAYLPEKYEIYEEVLNLWNTQNLVELDLLIFKLSEYHLLKNFNILQQHKEKEENGDAIEYIDVQSFLFPYEILAWLKLREKAGLKNPTEYTHPLMNTPIAKMFLELKEPLEKPTELPYAKELLEKLKEKCPDIEIPEWLGGEKEKETEPIPPIHLKSKQTVPKTGRYQATVVKGHRKEDLVNGSNFNIKHVKEGESIGTFGLSGNDESDIVWVYLGE